MHGLETLHHLLPSTTTTHHDPPLAITTHPHLQIAVAPKKLHGTHEPKTVRPLAPAHDDIAATPRLHHALDLVLQVAISTTAP